MRDLRRHSRSAVLRRLLLDGPASRTDLAAATGLSSAAVSNVTGELLNDGVIRQGGSRDSDGGRPSTLLEIDGTAGFVIGIDVGETRITAERFDLALEKSDELVVGLPSSVSPDGVAELVADSAARLGASSDAPLLGIGVGVPGIVARDVAGIVDAPSLRWESVPFGGLLAERLDLPWVIDNGAKAMTQAEQWFGAARGCDTALVVLIGVGIGSGLILDGALYRGRQSSAGEFGHVNVVPGGRSCRCGAVGCLEAHCGAGALLDQWNRRRRRTWDGHISHEAFGEFVAAIDHRQAAAVDTLEAAAMELATALGSAVNLLNPERIVIGGWAGLMLGDRLLDGVGRHIAAHSLRLPLASTTCVSGQLGPDAVAMGAATLPIQRLLDDGGVLAGTPSASTRSPNAGHHRSHQPRRTDSA